MTHNRRTFLRTIGAGSIGVTATGLFSGSAAAATVVTIKGAGYNIWYDHDEFHYFYQQESGDFDVVAHSMYVEDTHYSALAGIMVRNSLDSDSRNIILRRMPSGDGSVQWRAEDSGGTSGQPVGGFVAVDWLRVKRDGDTIIAYGSQGEPVNDDDWTEIWTSSSEDITFDDEVFVGLAVTSHDPEKICTATFKDVRGDFELDRMTSKDIGDPDIPGSVSIESGVPLVSTKEATDVDTTSATLNGEVTDLGGAETTECYFEYRERGSGDWSTTNSQTLDEEGTFRYELTNLSISLQDYEFRAVMKANDGDSDTGTIKTFNTPSVASVESVTDVSRSSATLNGIITAPNPAKFEAYFEHRKVPTVEWIATNSQTPAANGTVSERLSELTSRRYYQVRLVVENGDERAVSSSALFSTPNPSNSKASPTEPKSRSYFDPEDGFAELAPWLDDQTPVIKITEPTREMLERSDLAGERLVVFETSGTVDLEGDLSIRNDRMYLAGQTAPSPGITLIKGGFYIDADDCVVQHIRARAGDAGKTDDWEPDSIHTGDDTRNNVVDHISASWGIDETLSVGFRAENTTVSNCLISESIYHPLSLPEGETRGKGSLIGDDAENISLLGNIWSEHSGRNPRFKTGAKTALVNNIVYYFGGGTGLGPDTVASIVGNGFIKAEDATQSPITGGNAYLEDNYADPELDPLTDSLNELSEPPVWPEHLDAMPSEEVLDHNLTNAGARPADRTEHDERIVQRIIDGETHWIDSQEEVGGYPSLEENTHQLKVPNGGTRAWIRKWSQKVETEEGET